MEGGRAIDGVLEGTELGQPKTKWPVFSHVYAQGVGVAPWAASVVPRFGFARRSRTRSEMNLQWRLIIDAEPSNGVA
jgi:hypothetical protein